MRLRLLGLCLLIVITGGTFAQAPEALPLPEAPEEAVEGVADLPDDPAAQEAPEAARPRLVATHAAFGVIEADPNVTATLGTNDDGSWFGVNSLDGTPRFYVRGHGYVGIGTRVTPDALTVFKDLDTSIGIRLNNPNTAGASASTVLRFFEGSVYKAHLTSNNSAATGAGGANALQLWNRMNAPMVFATNNLERVRIHPGGSVGIGSTQDVGAKLFVSDTRDAAIGIHTVVTPVVEANTQQLETAGNFWLIEDVAAGVTNTGSVTGLRARAAVRGGGTVSQAIGQIIETGILAGNAGNVSTAYGTQIYLTAPAGSTVTDGYGLYIADVQATAKSFAIYQAGTNDANYLGGQVRIGSDTTVAGKEGAMLHVKGDAHFTGTVSGGNIQATYQDVAEWVPANEDLAPGTVVILNPIRANEVMPSGRPYDTHVAGVVSAQPGLSLGVAGEGKEQIATTGRVKVRVDARNAPVSIGDLLVTGELPGTAMRSVPVEIGGRQFHQPGTIIGKALEPLPDGVGEILVLLSMQ